MRKIGMTVADIVDAVAKGRVGHREAMERLGLSFYPELLDTMRANGRSLWAHNCGSATADDDTLDLLSLACRKSVSCVDEHSHDDPIEA